MQKRRLAALGGAHFVDGDLDEGERLASDLFPQLDRVVIRSVQVGNDGIGILQAESIPINEIILVPVDVRDLQRLAESSVVITVLLDQIIERAGEQFKRSIHPFGIATKPVQAVSLS